MTPFERERDEVADIYADNVISNDGFVHGVAQEDVCFSVSAIEKSFKAGYDAAWAKAQGYVQNQDQWHDNRKEVAEAYAALKEERVRYRTALEDIIKPEVIGDWLRRPNKQFDGSTPLQVIERGETDRLWRMIWHLREGNPG